MRAAYPGDDLIGILRRQLDDRRPDHRGLESRVMKVDAARAGVHAHVVRAAEEVVRVAVRPVRCALREHHGPSSR